MGQRDASLEPVGRPLSFGGASFAPMRATVGFAQPSDQDVRRAQRETVVRVSGRDPLQRLNRFALSLGAASSNARDAAPAAVTQLLRGKSAWNPAEGPDITRSQVPLAPSGLALGVLDLSTLGVANLASEEAYRLGVRHHGESGVYSELFEEAMAATDLLFQLSRSAVFRIVGPHEVEALVDGERHVLSTEHYRVALEFSSARRVGEVGAALAGDLRVEDLEALVDALTRQRILSTDRIEASEASLQTILHTETFRDAGLLPTIGRAIENGRAVVIPQAFAPDLAQRVYAALEQSENWKPYDGHKPFFHFHHHNLYGWSDLPPEVRECARILGSTPTKLLLSVLTGADCRGPLSIAASMYLPGDYSLPHNDAHDARSIAYVWYLTKDWRPEWGGQFVWCPSGAIVNPSFNTLIAFKVSSQSLHFVAPVSQRARGRRLSVNGWWRRASKPSGEAPAAGDRWPVPLLPGCYGAGTAPLDGHNDIVLL